MPKKRRPNNRFRLPVRGRRLKAPAAVIELIRDNAYALQAQGIDAARRFVEGREEHDRLQAYIANEQAAALADLLELIKAPPSAIPKRG